MNTVLELSDNQLLVIEGSKGLQSFVDGWLAGFDLGQILGNLFWG
ncbi:hypothetical protein GA0061078_0687 [Bifidobacterium bohemicum]|uniref:Uncharacterized protein n=1 Tax=Bifidobacterium bohemicum DSM 22767 TaxID=1437606 RepID=A0A086ZK81_9BIFI|nr:hypothetical protein [Bifidobacterium bohemicum]KFI46931.1 hypothetical protein BBOH_0405 [Bifidobacterium bohemicum DSM 22767]SCB85420.1 hypothetical protein GA0061078_0687 [Bifidobacterium bohemicum]